MAQAVELAPDYYLQNFRFLLDWVAGRFADLLTPQEQAFIAAFNQLNKPAQCLWVRLSSRKGPIFRSDKLHYPEIPNLEEAAAHLLQKELLLTDPSLEFATLAECLTKAELLQLFSPQLHIWQQEHKQPVKSARKETLIAALSNLFPAPRTWSQWSENTLGDAWALQQHNSLTTFLQLFFGNQRQNLSEFVLQDLGIFRYETYSIDPHHRIFTCRAELDTWQQLNHLQEQLAAASDITQVQFLAGQIPAPADHAKVRRRRAQLCNQIAQAYERAGLLNEALEFYQQSHLPPARQRHMRLLAKQGQLEAAWLLNQELISAPSCEAELHDALRFAPKLAKPLGKNWVKPKPVPISQQHLLLAPTTDKQGNIERVEVQVRRHVHTYDAPCFYVENSLFCSLFGLWLWPELFRSVPGAFANPFQTAPLDFYQEDFVNKRPGIEDLWRSLQGGDYKNNWRNTWQVKNGLANPLVHWGLLTEELLNLALECIPAEHLTAIFKRQLLDRRNNLSGLPDLIQFFPAHKTYQLIEVKGPNDRPQDNQVCWFDYFADHQIPAEVCYVRWQ